MKMMPECLCRRFAAVWYNVEFLYSHFFVTLQRKNQLRLDSGQISITQMKHATTKSANAAINNVEFHPEVPLLLVATRDKRLQLINVGVVTSLLELTDQDWSL